jgi:hypothetical protein
LPKGADPAVSDKALRRGGKGVAMGEVIRFPDEAGCARGGRYVDAHTEPATVIILPVIRVERNPDGSNGLEPDTGNTPGRRRRRRIAR